MPESLAWVKGEPPLLLHSTVLLVVAKSYVVRQSVAGRNQSAGRQESSHSDQPVLAVAETRTATTIDFQIRGFEPLSVVMTNDRLNEFSFAAAGGSPAYRYFVNGVETTETTQRITQSDTYEVRVIDQNGCESVASLYVEYFDIEVPDYFSPDGDNMNEAWAPVNREAFPEILTIIFDRYGREIYRMELEDDPWDGLYNNTELPSGDYWYVIKLRGENDKRQFVGHFTLYR